MSNLQRCQIAYDLRMPTESDELECPTCGEVTSNYLDCTDEDGIDIRSTDCDLCLIGE